MSEADLQDVLHRIEALEERIGRPSTRWLTLKAASEYSSISVTSLRRHIKAKRLTAHRPCRGTILIDVRELDQFIAKSAKQIRNGRGSATTRARARDEWTPPNKRKSVVGRGPAAKRAPAHDMIINHGQS